MRLARSHWIFSHSEEGFLVGLGGSHLWVSQTAKLIWMIPSFDDERRPNMAGPGLSATYNCVCRHLECLWPLGSHSMAVSKALKCGMLDHCMLSG